MMIFSADWHIRYDYNIKGHETICGDIEISINQICNYIKQLKPSAIFLLGDITDTPYVSSKGLAVLNNFIDVCKTENCKIFYILGQHDRSNPPLLGTISSYCTYIHKKHVVVDGYDIYGLNCLQEAQQIDEQADIIVTHQVWKEFLPINGLLGMHNMPNAPLIISGDYHKATEIQMGERTLISPGPIYPVRIHEMENKSIVTLENGTIDRLPIKTRPIHVVRVETEQDVELLFSDFKHGRYTSHLSDYPQGIRKPVLILKYNPSLERLSDIRALIGDSCYLEISFLHDQQEPDNEGPKDEAPDFEFGSVEDMIRALGDDHLITSLALAYWRDGEKPMEEFFYQGKIPHASE